MQNLVQKYVERFLHERAARRRMAQIMLLLALVVVVGVYWQLRLSGSAMSNEVNCGQEEHTHSQECYERVLICDLEEKEGHTHEDTCYEMVQTLICGLEENEEHIHTETCYQTEEKLVCGLEEGDGHTHTEACYEEQLICGLEEHTHTIECMIDETADVETAADWLSTIPTLKGDCREDLIAVAKSQIGYSESSRNFTLDEDGTTHRGYTRYGEWYGNKYGDWDAMFVSFCLTYAGIPSSEFPQASGAYAWRAELSRCGLYKDSSDYSPKAGDLVFFDKDADGSTDHVGIVSYVTETAIQVIEGDSNDQVEMNTFAIVDRSISGYGQLPDDEDAMDSETEVGTAPETESETWTAPETENETWTEPETESETWTEPESETETETDATLEAANAPADGETTDLDIRSEIESEEILTEEILTEEILTEEALTEKTLTEQTLKAETDGISVSINGLLPEGAVVSAIPVEVDMEDREVLFALDITIFYEDGEVFEPENGTVTVTITSEKITGDNRVYYVPEEGEPQELANNAQDGCVVFDAEHFSTYAVTASETSESDTVIASGTLANAAGTEDAITWVITEDDAGDRTLTVSGEGAIPDYSSQEDGQPWYSYRLTETKLVFGEGITRVGTNAFRSWTFTDIVFSSTIESIGEHAFSYTSSTLKSVTIPGNIKTVEKNAFIYSYGLVDIILEEGVESIGSSAFGSQASSDTVITIPASVKSIGSGTPLETNCFWRASEFVVAEDNEYYCAVDGVLYSKDMTVLVDYPNQKVADSYTIPASVETAAYGALVNVSKTSELYITENADITLYGYFLRYSAFSYVYIADGVQLPSSRVFCEMKNLETVRLPEDTAFEIGSAYFYTDTMLTSLKIPDGTTTLGSTALEGVTNLEILYYDARNAKIYSDLFGTAAQPMFDLTIGSDVEYLEANFSYILAHANSVLIEGENTFYAEEGVFENASVPYTGLSGWVYVTEEGVIYSLDPESGEATLYYCPGDVTTLTIPATLTTVIEEAEKTFVVTTVASNALKDAEILTSVIFEDASCITNLEAYALANAPVVSVRDAATDMTAYTVTDAETLFTNTGLFMGYQVFYNTNLGEADKESDYSAAMSGVQSAATGEGTGMTVTVTPGTTTEWKYTDDSQTVGGYTSLTGDTVTFVVSASNTTGGSVTYRLYLQTTGDDCIIPTVGEHTVNGVTYTVYATEDPYTIYLEFTAEDSGDTKNFNVTAVYPNPGSAGGGVTVWGVAMEENEDGVLLESESTESICAYWETLPDTYTLDKTNNNQDSISIAADDNGIVRPSAELKYQITLTSEGETSTFGKDYVTVVTYTDVLTLPAGMSWDPDILAAIKGEDGASSLVRRSNALYLGDTKLVALSLVTSSGLSLGSLAASYDEETGQVVLSWKVRNSSDYNLNTNTLNLTIYPEALLVDSAVYRIEAENVITNEATVSVYYTYSSTKISAASVDKSVTGGSGTVKISKTKINDVAYFGEDLSYSIKVYNNGGLSYSDPAGAYTVTDTLSDTLYISAANLETMFQEAAKDGTALTVTITGAKLGTGATVSDTSGGGSALVNTGNSNLSGETSGNTLTITCGGSGGTDTADASDLSNDTGTTDRTDLEGETDDSAASEDDSSDAGTALVSTYTVTASDGQSVSGTDLAALLQSLGYGVTRSAVYQCDWVLPVDTEGCFVLASGQSYTYTILATVKSTFQILDGSDWPGKYQGPDFSITNRATLIPAVGSTQGSIGASAATDSVKREALISKSVAKDGENLGSAPEASDGDILDYTLTFVHYGDGVYEDLPMVDDLYGSQYLLVLAAENPALAGNAGVEVYIDEDTDTEYYILREGTFYDVTVGSMTAASVTVTSGTDETFQVNDESYTWSGVHTQIKWYFSSTGGGNYTMRVTYQVLVDTTGYETDYTIGNMVWMNDRLGSRLYAGLWGGGTIIGFAKDIVADASDPEADLDNDGIDDDGFCEIEEGAQVTYRLTLSSNGDGGNFTLAGKNLADLLPETYGVFEWNTENVSVDRIVVETGNTGTVTGTESLEDWYIGTEYNGIKGDGLYFILWSDDVSVSFSGNAKVYLYVTLTFPSDTENTDTEEAADTETGATWSAYAEAAKGATLSNTLYVYRNPANVTHVLAEEGSALLQKGVYALLRCSLDAQLASVTSGNYYSTGSTRDYYNNQDSNYRYVLYYLVLYNDGGTRLYINDIYDDLPEGFSYVSLVSDASFVDTKAYAHTNAITTLSDGSGGTWLTEQEDGVTYMSASVSASSSDGQIQFSIGAGNSTYALSYDEEQGQYYLDYGQAIVFGYICQIGTSEETEVNAVNTAAMSYTDYTGAGVSAGSMNFKAGELSQYNSRNDGGCVIYTASEAAEAYGFSDTTGNTRWLVSSVTLTKGGIKPGVIKETVSYQVSESSEPIEYTNSVTYKDLVNWQATLQNGGEMSIVDYVVTDTMPYPYVFTGVVTCTIYDSNNRQILTGSLFTFPGTAETTSLSDGDIVTVYKGYEATATAAITVGGEAVEMNSAVAQYGQALTYSLRLDIDESGNLIMEIHMEDIRLGIPEGGYVVLNYTSWNPTSETSNQTLINQVSMVTSQVIDKGAIQSGSAVYDADGNVVGASSLSPITVTAGYSTNSYKTVAENQAVESGTDSATDSGSGSGAGTGINIAYSNSTDNTILLSDASSTFIYTLNVQNINNEAITKMVLIDNLPSEGDFYTYNTDIERNSAFTVELADTAVTVMITSEEGEVTVLGADDYTVEGSSFTPTADQAFSAEDRAGANTGKWTDLAAETNLTAIRSVRIIINAEIPANASVTVSFTARIREGETPSPGSIAWNNFGYGYWVGNSSTELEAMPLCVGVKVPSAPELVKKLVDENGDAATASENQVFSFLIYRTEEVEQSGEEGTAGTGTAGTLWKDVVWTYTGESLLANGEEIELDTGDYKIISVTVKAEKSASEVFALSEDVVGWAWETGKEYTIVELTQDALGGNYALKEWDAYGSRVSTENSYTFVYDPETTLTLTCVNFSEKWTIDLTKVDKAGKTEEGTYETVLEGAVFALYSQTESGLYAEHAEEIGQGAEAYLYEEADTDPAGSIRISWTLTVDGDIWYLYGVSMSEEDGTLAFPDLTLTRYYLVETKAPDGYNLDASPILVERKDASGGIYTLVVENQAGTHLPLTGGPGTQKAMGFGLTLMAGAMMLQALRRRKKKEQNRF